MPTIDVRNILGSVVNVINSRANRICASTCDGLVLRMHYRWTFLVLVAGFLTVWYSWYQREVIACVSHFNSEAQVRLDYINVCLSYPYVEEEDSKRRYLLFYRWISWALLALAFVYYIPRKISKNLDNPRCRKLLEDLAGNAHHYGMTEKELLKRVAMYLLANLRTHNGLYWKFLLVNILCVMIDTFAVLYLDFILQGRFFKYGINAYPFERDPKTFSDYISQTFPPFAFCELTREYQIVSKRTEKFGCHLTIMELYEKVFLALWVWLIFLTVASCGYIVFLLSIHLPLVQVFLLRAAKPAHANIRIKETIDKVLKDCKIGDVYLLYRLKSHLSHAKFCELLRLLSDASTIKRQAQPRVPSQFMAEDKSGMQLSQQASLRYRGPRASENASSDADSPNPTDEDQKILLREVFQQIPEEQKLLQGHAVIPIE